jgi:hypothetical protein
LPIYVAAPRYEDRVLRPEAAEVAVQKLFRRIIAFSRPRKPAGATELIKNSPTDAFSSSDKGPPV